MSRETWTSNAMLPVLPYVVRVAWLFIAGGMVRSWVTGLRERAPQSAGESTDWECCSFSAKVVSRTWWKLVGGVISGCPEAPIGGDYRPKEITP